jgi:hypothetical protein
VGVRARVGGKVDAQVGVKVVGFRVRVRAMVAKGAG